SSLCFRARAIAPSPPLSRRSWRRGFRRSIISGRVPSAASHRSQTIASESPDKSLPRDSLETRLLRLPASASGLRNTAGRIERLQSSLAPFAARKAPECGRILSSYESALRHPDAPAAPAPPAPPV